MWSQWQRTAETHQLLRGEEVELRGAQELLQLQLAQEMGKAGRSCRAAHSKLQDILNKLCWEMDGCPPAPSGTTPKALLGSMTTMRCRAPAPLMEMGLNPGSSQPPGQALVFPVGTAGETP